MRVCWLVSLMMINIENGTKRLHNPRQAGCQLIVAFKTAKKKLLNCKVNVPVWKIGKSIGNWRIS